MAVAAIRLNFFNIVVIPALLGLGVDHGVHYYRRWKELGRNSAETLRELLGPMTTCTLTTMMGYSGMAIARHEGYETYAFSFRYGQQMTTLGLFEFPWLAQLVGLAPFSRTPEALPPLWAALAAVMPRFQFQRVAGRIRPLRRMPRTVLRQAFHCLLKAFARGFGERDTAAACNKPDAQP